MLAHSEPGDSIVDIGGGESTLVDELLDRGYEDLTVADLSGIALDHSRARLGERAHRVRWIQADITELEPDRTWQLWHDRAVFHFLVTAAARAAYVGTAARAVARGGVLVVATFGPHGPDRCAGLPVCRYELDELAATFGAGFEPVDERRIEPDPRGIGDQRPYVALAMRRSADV